jgi:hypothetical protein
MFSRAGGRRIVSVALVILTIGAVSIAAAASPAGTAGTWRVVPNPGDGVSDTLYAVSALSANDAWAVGSIDSGTSSATMAIHWDGTTWTEVPTPGPLPGAYLADVLALRHGDVWAVGTASPEGSLGGRPLIEHWNGRRWSVVSGPNPANTQNLYRIVKGTDGSLWAIGVTIVWHTASFTTFTERWNGSSWSVVPSPNEGYDSFLWGATGVPGGEPWSFGWFDTGHEGKTLAEHWDGQDWHVVRSPTIPRATACWRVARPPRRPMCGPSAADPPTH